LLTMYNKVVRELDKRHASAEQAWDLVKQGKVLMSHAEEAIFASLEAEGKRDLFLSKVRGYLVIPPVVGSAAGQSAVKQHCIREVNAIIERCKAEGTKWTDPEWDVKNNPEFVLYVDQKAPGWDCTVAPPVGFKRLTEIVAKSGSGQSKAPSSLFGGFAGAAPKKKKKKPVVFKDGIKPGDIVQGQIGTCFLLGALGAIAGHSDEKVQRMFIKYDVDVGVYGMLFNVDGEWTYVLVDDYFPVDHNGELVYSRCQEPDEVWVPLIEKAFCKLHTCYEMCDGGQSREAINSFFGGVGGRFPIKRMHKRDPSRFFKVMKQARDKGWLLTTGFKASGASTSGGKCGEAVADNGLVAGHAYSVLKLVNAHGHMLVCCRNPWGTGEWTGRWSDENDYGEWTEQMIKATGKVFEDDGKFWMSIEDFVENSIGVEYARSFGPNWKKTTHYARFSSEKLVAAASRAFSSTKSDELSFSTGDKIEVATCGSAWWKGRSVKNGSEGFFPCAYVQAKNRSVTRYDMVGTADPSAEGPMSVVVMVLQPNVMMRRKWTKRPDGTTYKDLHYTHVALIVIGPDGEVAVKKEGQQRCLWTELKLPGGGLWKLYAVSTDGSGGDFTLRVFMKDGLCTVEEKYDAKFSEVRPLLENS